MKDWLGESIPLLPNGPAIYASRREDMDGESETIALLDVENSAILLRGLQSVSFHCKSPWSLIESIAQRSIPGIPPAITIRLRRRGVSFETLYRS